MQNTNVFSILTPLQAIEQINDIYALLYTTWTQTPIESYRKWFEIDSSVQVYTCKNNNKIIAVAITDVRDNLDLSDDRDTLYLSNVCVHPDFRRKHIGKQLIEFVKHNTDTTYLVLKVANVNKSAIDFYMALNARLYETSDTEYTWLFL
jgi:ribosomal protein S18 acetylase RimI-like enzyme